MIPASIRFDYDIRLLVLGRFLFSAFQIWTFQAQLEP